MRKILNWFRIKEKKYTTKGVVGLPYTSYNGWDYTRILLCSIIILLTIIILKL